MRQTPYMEELREREHRALVEAHGRRCDGAITVLGALIIVAILTGVLA